jgi:hypothetical protein
LGRTNFQFKNKNMNEEQNINKPLKPAFLQGAVSGSRLSGKTNAMILSIIPELKAGGKIGVAGCKDPKDITERLKAHGIDVKSEPMIRKGQAQPIYDDEGIIGFKNSDDMKTGFLFYCH